MTGWIMKRNDTKEMVMARLTMNDGVPMLAKQFKAILGIDARELREVVRDLRMEHVKVCSGNQGYWLWDGHDDSWNRTKARIRSQAVKEYQLLSAMENEVLDGQQTMDLKERAETWRKALMNL